MVLVLAVVPPPPAERRRRGAPSCRAGGRLPRRVADPGDERADAVAGEHRLEVVDHVVGDGALGQHHHVDDVDLVERRGQDAVDEIEVERLGRGELEEAERLAFDALDRCLERPEVALADAQRPRQEQDVDRLPPRVDGRDAAPGPCATRRRRLDRARRRSGRATATRCRRPACAPSAAPAARQCRRGTATRCGRAARVPGRAARSRRGGALDGDAHAGAGLVGDGVQRQQCRHRPASRDLRRLTSMGVALRSRTTAQASATSVGGGLPVAGRSRPRGAAATTPSRPVADVRRRPLLARPAATRRTGRPRTARGRPR